MTSLAEFRERYWPLVVTACEWRAMQADPELLAARVFTVLGEKPGPPDQHQTYRVLEQVVFDSYVQASASRSILDQLRGERRPLANAPVDDAVHAALRDAVTRLGGRDREVLQLCYWDELSEAEAAEALGIDLDKLQERRDRALDRYRALLRRHVPSVDPAAASQLFRSVKPGRPTRWE